LIKFEAGIIALPFCQIIKIHCQNVTLNLRLESQNLRTLP